MTCIASKTTTTITIYSHYIICLQAYNLTASLLCSVSPTIKNFKEQSLKFTGQGKYQNHSLEVVCFITGTDQSSCVCPTALKITRGNLMINQLPIDQSELTADTSAIASTIVESDEEQEHQFSFITIITLN